MSTALMEPARLPSGVPGLDDALLGGLPRGLLILVEGPPGSGKTTMGLQLLLQAVRRGETCLLASNAETPEQLGSIAASHGWQLDGVNITEFDEGKAVGEEAQSDYTLFPEAEVEIGETLERLFSEVDRLKPSLLVLDAISSLRVLAPTPAFHRRQLKRIRDFMAARSCTTVMLDEASSTEKDLRSQTLSDGVIELLSADSDYGADRRRLRIRKLRGCRYHSGAHDFAIERGGIVVYPRFVALSYRSASRSQPIQSGMEHIDALTGGALPRASSTLIVGPAGIGKSTLSALYVVAAAARGEKSSVLLFDESIETYLARCEGLGLDATSARDRGLIHFFHLDPAELSVGQIAHLLIKQVEEQDTRIVIIDTLNGYLQSAREEPTVLLHLRELISYLSRRQVAALLTLTVHGVIGADMTTPVDLSFLVDNVFLLRFFEHKGAIHKALSVVKKRSGAHESTIRELVVSSGRIEVSDPLEGFSGVLTGVPVFASRAGFEGD